MLLPAEARPLALAFLPVFTHPTYLRFLTLAAAAILTTGRRTVANVLRTVGDLAPGHPASYRRVLSAAEWSGLELGCALARFLLDHLVPDGPIDLVGDDTVDGHPGPRVYGKGRHRDAVRSSHTYTAWRCGHKWVVLAVLVKFPFATRRWALPVLVDLYRTPEVSAAEGVRHRTPGQLMCRLLRVLLARFPDRTFVFAGDSGYGTHEVARFCHRHRRRLTLVSKLHPDANLFESPPPYAGNGRPRVKGRRVPKPRQAAATARRARLTVAWYGGGTRRVEAATGTGHWYKGGHGLVPIRWVFVKDTTGTHRDEYLFTTDTSRTADAVVGTYCGRWSIETTFQECRPCIGLETTRGRSRKTVCRAAPCLFGLYSVVAVLYHALPAGKRTGGITWIGKEVVTFSDALTAVRRWIWAEGVFKQAKIDAAIADLPAHVRELLLSGLAPAP
ncbi:IS701 family transposase [Limnoglobus roseus]|uniref:Transposase n=1 Tax=Limnoglobus roseus TaxID=2598579 RepID=A0A5C1AG85_9BACT|nr:transposase [Limnoglobus roseus]QEL17157.1 transposase [Limnoglobus roseus]